MRKSIPSGRQQLSGSGPRLRPEVDAIIDSVIGDACWSQGRVTLIEILREVAFRISEVNHTRQKEEQLRLPARSTVYRRFRVSTAPRNRIKALEPDQSARRSATEKACKTDERQPVRDLNEEGLEILAFPSPVPEMLVDPALRAEKGSTLTDDRTTHDISIDPQAWRTLAERQRYDMVDRIEIRDRRRSALLAELDCLADYSSTSGAGMPRCLLLLGESGVGKTMLVSTWMQQATAFSASPTSERIAPYVYVCLPASATPRGIMASCFTSLGSRDFPLRGELEMMKRLLSELRRLAVRMLILDNLEHLINRDNNRVRVACLEVLEDLVMQAGSQRSSSAQPKAGLSCG